MSIWVVNTSPLVFLGNLGRLELLRYEGREVCIPRAVAEEIAEKPNAATQAVQDACATWMQVRQVTNSTAVTLVQAALHRGEAEAIVLATELHAERLDVHFVSPTPVSCSLGVGAQHAAPLRLLVMYWWWIYETDI